MSSSSAPAFESDPSACWLINIKKQTDQVFLMQKVCTIMESTGKQSIVKLTQNAISLVEQASSLKLQLGVA